MAYIVHNHVFSLALPIQNDAFLISVNLNRATSYAHVLRQIPKKELLKLLPETWVTNYEKLH